MAVSYCIEQGSRCTYEGLLEVLEFVEGYVHNTSFIWMIGVTDRKWKSGTTTFAKPFISNLSKSASLPFLAAILIPQLDVDQEWPMLALAQPLSSRKLS
jgi:hypothetical protein